MMLNNPLNQLRAKLNVRLPISDQIITILEPLAKQRFGILNNFIALQTRADITEQERNAQMQKILTDAIIKYILDNIESDDPKFNAMQLDANELLVFIFGLIELLSNAWFITYEVTCKHCGAKQEMRLVFEPNMFTDPNASVAQRIDYIKKLFDIDDNNFGEIKIVLPENKLEPKIIEKEFEDKKIKIKLYYPIAKILFDSMIDTTKITKAQLSYIHELLITNIDNTKFFLTYNASISTQMLDALENLPEMYYKLIISEINKYDKVYNEEYKIAWKYNFVCASCKKLNEMQDLDMFSYFFNYHLSNIS